MQNLEKPTQVAEAESWSVSWDGIGRFNRVEGLTFGAGLTAQSTLRPQGKVYIKGAYGLSRGGWTYEFGVERSWPGENRLSVGANLHDLVATQNDWIVSDQEAAWLMLLVASETRDYFRQQGYEIYFSQRLGEANTLKIGYCGDLYGSLRKKTDWTLFNWTGGKRSNPPIDEGKINSVKISFDGLKGG